MPEERPDSEAQQETATIHDFRIDPAPGVTMGKVIAVMSGKGGVGKSSLAALLAVALRRRGHRVGLLDADITGPSIPRLLGLRARPSVADNGLVRPVESRTGIEVMSINLLLDEDDRAVIWRGPIITGVIKQFYRDVLWSDPEYLVVDLPPGTGDAPLTVLQSLAIDGILLVSSPQELARMVVSKARHMAEALEAPIIGVVENMSYFECPGCGERAELFGPGQSEEQARAAGWRLLGKLPLDPGLATAGDAGELEAYEAPWVDDLARWVTEHVQRREPKVSS